MPLAPRIFKRLSELLDVTGQTGIVYVTGGTASFITTTGSGSVVRSTSPTFSGTTVMDGLTADNATIDLLHVTGASMLDSPVGMADALTVLGSGIYLGHASDTLLARVSPGVASIAGSTILVAGGALGTPASGTVTNLTGTASININGTVGATTPAAGSFTTGAFSGILTSSERIRALGGDTQANPALSFNTDTDTGWSNGSTNALDMICGAAQVFRSTSTLWRYNSALVLAWGSSGISTADISAYRSAANELSFGVGAGSGTAGNLKFNNGTLSGALAVTGTVTEGGSAAGAVTTQTRLVKAVASIADNTATTVLTITIPNAAHSASVRVRLIGAAGLGGAINLAREATATIAYDIAVTRTAGSLAVATISSAFGSASASVAGGSVLTVAGTITHGGEGTGVANTYLVKVTIDDTTGSATNHTCQVVAELANAAATGITMT